MIFSAHVADTGPIKALRRKPPTSAEAPGISGAVNLTGSPFTKGMLPRPQLGREVLMAWWDTEADLDTFLADNPVGQEFATGWHARCELVRATGVWPGLDTDLVDLAGAKGKDMTGPTLAVTIGSAYFKKLPKFLKVNSALEDQFMVSDGTLWGTLSTNLPKLMVATLTVWENSDAALDYMKTGAHAQAIADHYDPVKDPTGHTFVTGGGFFGFRPLSVSGSVQGRNPLAATLLDGRI